MDIRIGNGYDVHRLEVGEELWIGGVLFPHSKGAVGHSDADVLLHAICDALLGALALRDIGYHFPDTDPSYKGVDSKELLATTWNKVESMGWSFGNLDTVVCLQTPKLSEGIDEMRGVIARILSVDKEKVSIKATTTEKLGFVGTQDGISAHAVVLLKK
ncbi:MAG: 2-C-methyl-D-erythritol 2,4-cyclodiphosphate synthase [Mariprofundaceae bacterium]|nr:2-C-methyl-D-erythritol 2,4-cyclodiphosphate synthase [Mariprofundaceae bacterium]PCJ80670.1 MAG: 2-C-methyl-D-erythritol 2,4-cyclodiphosphate synthase [Bacteroidota bacterium]